ncbi:MAG: hypothetical protein V7642_3778 [Burkholderiales bacterium]
MPDDASAVLGKMYWHNLRGERITSDLVANILELNWYVTADDANALADELAENYGRYKRH